MGLLWAGVALGLSACKFFDLGNPLLPKSRAVAFPEPSMINVQITYQRSTNVFNVQAEDVTVRVQSFPNDAGPGVQFEGYTAEYLDQTGLPIASLLLSKVDLDISGYLPPASSQRPANLELTLPIYNQQVRGYGIDQVFVFKPTPALNRQLIHTITCRVTLKGVDDNFNEVEIPVSVPIRFEGNISE